MLLLELKRYTSMIKIETIEVAGLASVMRALRLPFGKDARSHVESDATYKVDKGEFLTKTTVDIDDRDMKLLETLVKSGDEHAKVLRGLVVYVEITAPIWFYRELETYRVGRERLSSESTMHIDCKGLSGEELESAKDDIPMGHKQRTVDMYSYQTLRRIYFQRKNHKLPMWHDFCSFIETLPFAKELILCQREKK